MENLGDFWLKAVYEPVFRTTGAENAAFIVNQPSLSHSSYVNDGDRLREENERLKRSIERLKNLTVAFLNGGADKMTESIEQLQIERDQARDECRHFRAENVVIRAILAGGLPEVDRLIEQLQGEGSDLLEDVLDIRRNGL